MNLRSIFWEHQHKKGVGVGFWLERLTTPYSASLCAGEESGRVGGGGALTGSQKRRHRERQQTDRHSADGSGTTLTHVQVVRLTQCYITCQRSHWLTRQPGCTLMSLILSPCNEVVQTPCHTHIRCLFMWWSCDVEAWHQLFRHIIKSVDHKHTYSIFT